MTVTGEANVVQFNTGKLETTVDSKLTNSVPQLYRTPFLLAQLDPAVEKSDSQTEYMPYHSWGPNTQRVGGGQNYTADLQVDGAPVGIGYKTSYVPSPDMVQEVNVQQNAVDAEYGHSAGSAISLTLKSGTNQWHGTAFYQGQYPWANALEDRVYRTVNLGTQPHVRRHAGSSDPARTSCSTSSRMKAGSRRTRLPLMQTLPTDLERMGDFSQSLNNAGGLRTIYDPWSTQTSPDGKTITRTPFPGNVIPQNRLDPVAVAYVSKLWKPNAPGIGPYHVNNYSVALPIQFPYKNFSDRADYNITDKLRVSGRFSMFKTPVTSSNPTGSDYFVSDRGSNRDAKSITGDADLHAESEHRHQCSAAIITASWISRITPRSFQRMAGARSFRITTSIKQVFQDPSVPVQLPRMSITGTDGSRAKLQHGSGRRLLESDAHRKQLQCQDCAAARSTLSEGGLRDARHSIAAGPRVEQSRASDSTRDPPATPT